jgi:hypothetical protein
MLTAESFITTCAHELTHNALWFVSCKPCLPSATHSSSCTITDAQISYRWIEERTTGEKECTTRAKQRSRQERQTRASGRQSTKQTTFSILAEFCRQSRRLSELMHFCHSSPKQVLGYLHALLKCLSPPEVRGCFMAGEQKARCEWSRNVKLQKNILRIERGTGFL